jgi:esterase/lipase superfamily enzyme
MLGKLALITQWDAFRMNRALYWGLLFCALWIADPRVAASQEVAWRGLSVISVTPDVAKTRKLAVSFGALVIKVAPESPPAIAGLRQGDVIIAVDDNPVSNSDELVELLKRLEKLDAVKLTRLRGKQDEKTVIVTLADVFASESRGYMTEAPSPPPPVLPRSAMGPEALGHTVVKVHYATDRHRTQAADPNEVFGAERGELTFGICEVTIPLSHAEGALEGPSVFRFEYAEDPSQHVVLRSVKQQSSAEFYADVGKQIKASPERSAFVFVHGYNVKFKDAARRTAQIAYDLKFQGAPVFFSWPSTGKYLGYVTDESNVDFGRTDLKKFLSEFVAHSPAEKIYLVAHSMGNRALTLAAAEILRDIPVARAKIREVILAAPDIDADVFKREIAPALTKHGPGVTLYASSNDWALIASKTFHGYPRAGDTGEKLTVVNGIATIDSSDIPTGLLGHSYFAEAQTILKDIGAIFRGKSLPAARDYLVVVESPVGKYWKMPKAE